MYTLETRIRVENIDFHEPNLRVGLLNACFSDTLERFLGEKEGKVNTSAVKAPAIHQLTVELPSQPVSTIGSLPQSLLGPGPYDEELESANYNIEQPQESNQSTAGQSPATPCRPEMSRQVLDRDIVTLLGRIHLYGAQRPDFST